ncbi:hypothetical protein D915_007743 [Fasciola hepatica]|uniref:RING-type domain-containing protein n=1 Tax=Fasciola hepatica TaxID=6192 RepID=A0A4E0RUN8_FASHE|nr:hypothetical protein D915_007743 [Fasciola hepatica]
MYIWVSIKLLSNENCVVCWESLDEAGELPCGHTFHTACLRKWLERSAHCPTCRTHLISLDTEATPSLESEQWGSVGAPEASHLMQQSTQPLSEFAHASSELQQTRKQNEHIDALKTESVIENYGSCSSCSEYAGPSGYGSTSKTMSAMVCIHRLLDVSNDSRNEGANGAEMNVQPCSPLLPDKFVEALEAELIHYFQRKVSPTDSDTHCSVSQRDASMCRKHTVRATATGGHSYDPSSSTTTRPSHREFSEAIGIPQSDSVTIEQMEFPPKRVLRMAIRHLIHRVTQAGAAARVVGAHVASLTSSSSDEESIESYNPRGLSHQPIHLRRGGNSVPEVTSSLRESSDHMRDTGATVFHSTHALRERSLERRKVAIRNRARLNFLRNQKVVAVE